MDIVCLRAPYDHSCWPRLVIAMELCTCAPELAKLRNAVSHLAASHLNWRLLNRGFVFKIDQAAMAKVAAPAVADRILERQAGFAAGSHHAA